MSTATEVMMRMREAEKRMEPMRKRMDEFSQALFDNMFNGKVPLPRYGRRKRQLCRRWGLIVDLKTGKAAQMWPLRISI